MKDGKEYVHIILSVHGTHKKGEKEYRFFFLNISSLGAVY